VTKILPSSQKYQPVGSLHAQSRKIKVGVAKMFSENVIIPL